MNQPNDRYRARAPEARHIMKPLPAATMHPTTLSAPNEHAKKPSRRLGVIAVVGAVVLFAVTITLIIILLVT
ncbi:MAG: hypothetical protein FWD83_00990 [Promicromonosporaceae bacterium]|nr:hypothetical protein [Promicromonosporaceae bacterium]